MMTYIDMGDGTPTGKILNFNGNLYEIIRWETVHHPFSPSTLLLNLSEVNRAELRSRLVTARDAAQAAFEVADEARAEARASRNAACTALTDFDRAT